MPCANRAASVTETKRIGKQPANKITQLATNSDTNHLDINKIKTTTWTKNKTRGNMADVMSASLKPGNIKN